MQRMWLSVLLLEGTSGGDESGRSEHHHWSVWVFVRLVLGSRCPSMDVAERRAQQVNISIEQLVLRNSDAQAVWQECYFDFLYNLDESKLTRILVDDVVVWEQTV